MWVHNGTQPTTSMHNSCILQSISFALGENISRCMYHMKCSSHFKRIDCERRFVWNYVSMKVWNMRWGYSMIGKVWAQAQKCTSPQRNSYNRKCDWFSVAATLSVFKNSRKCIYVSFVWADVLCSLNNCFQFKVSNRWWNGNRYDFLNY